jgi:hypothetical protein
MKDITPFLWYIAGSVCFIIGSILSIGQKLGE